MPLVTRGFGAEWAKHYEFDNPSVTRAGDRVRLLFRFDDKKDRNLIAVDPPYWGIELDVCTLKVIDSYEVSGTVIEGPGMPGLTPPRASP